MPLRTAWSFLSTAKSREWPQTVTAKRESVLSAEIFILCIHGAVGVGVVESEVLAERGAVKYCNQQRTVVKVCCRPSCTAYLESARRLLLRRLCPRALALEMRVHR